MKVWYLRILSIVCIIATLLSLVACQKSQEEEQSDGTVYHTVKFNTNGGSAIPSIKIESGRVATRPDDPVLDNYVFCRWEYNNLPWIFTESRVKQDMTLNAIWVSADVLFGIDPVDDGISLKGLNRQESFEWLNVPSMINGKTVVAVSDEAFEAVHENYSKQIIFPKTLKRIGNASFRDISKTKITFNGTITSLGESAFERCTTLEEITLGEGLAEIPYRAFTECTAIKHIEIPAGATVIREDAFAGCTSLITIVLPSTLTSIENGAFDDCDAIKSVFFKGTQEQFDAITFSTGNNTINGADLYLFSEEEPIDAGNYWHYDKNGSPVIW